LTLCINNTDDDDFFRDDVVVVSLSVVGWVENKKNMNILSQEPSRP